jgi:nudix-type nucleoside diphosphatase (YffH/AdpP family)
LTLHETARYVQGMTASILSAPTEEKIRIKAVQTLSDDWYVLKKTTFELLRRDGTWQQQSRETYDRGNGATILLYNLEHRTVVLTRQFRFPAYVNGHSGMLIEAAAGLLDKASPEDRIKAEAEEETGYRVSHVQKIFEAFMSPGSVTERLYFLSPSTRAELEQRLGAGITPKGKISKFLSSPSNKRWGPSPPGRSKTARPSCFSSTPSSTFSQSKELPDDGLSLLRIARADLILGHARGEELLGRVLGFDYGCGGAEFVVFRTRTVERTGGGWWYCDGARHLRRYAAACAVRDGGAVQRSGGDLAAGKGGCATE